MYTAIGFVNVENGDKASKKIGGKIFSVAFITKAQGNISWEANASCSLASHVGFKHMYKNRLYFKTSCSLFNI